MPLDHWKPRRLILFQRRRAARKAEAHVAAIELPAHVAKGVLKRHPTLSKENVGLVEKGLRDWFICCAWRGRHDLGMPSQAVDEAWHEFTLDTASYGDFCKTAFGKYLSHTQNGPKSNRLLGTEDSLAETVRAWDRSEAGSGRESVLWDLDAQIGMPSNLGIDRSQLHVARTRPPYPLATGWVGNWDGMYVGSGDIGGGFGDGGGDGGGG